MEKINEIKIPDGVESISVTQHDDKIIIEFIAEKPKFKNGDFVYEDERIMIVKSYPDEFHAIVWHTRSYKPRYNGTYLVNFSAPTFRYASDVEKQILIDAMKRDGKRWNAEKLIVEDIPKPKFKVGDKVKIKDGISSETHESIRPYFESAMDKFIGKKLTVKEHTDNGHVIISEDDLGYIFAEDWLEPYTEELKKGDLAIFWGDNNLNPTIRLYHVKSYNGHSDNFGTIWGKAVKWDGTKEQFEKVLRGEI